MSDNKTCLICLIKNNTLICECKNKDFEVEEKLKTEIADHIIKTEAKDNGWHSISRIEAIPQFNSRSVQGGDNYFEFSIQCIDGTMFHFFINDYDKNLLKIKCDTEYRPDQIKWAYKYYNLFKLEIDRCSETNEIQSSSLSYSCGPISSFTWLSAPAAEAALSKLLCLHIDPSL